MTGLEKEFSIYRQSCGGNYFISFEEILHSLNLERLKLFSKLNINGKLERPNINPCDCKINKTEEEDLLESCFNDASDLSINEKSTLYFISGYVTKRKIFLLIPYLKSYQKVNLQNSFRGDNYCIPQQNFMICLNISFLILKNLTANAAQSFP